MASLAAAPPLAMNDPIKEPNLGHEHVNDAPHLNQDHANNNHINNGIDPAFAEKGLHVQNATHLDRIEAPVTLKAYLLCVFHMTVIVDS